MERRSWRVYVEVVRRRREGSAGDCVARSAPCVRHRTPNKSPSHRLEVFLRGGSQQVLVFPHGVAVTPDIDEWSSIPMVFSSQPSRPEGCVGLSRRLA